MSAEPATQAPPREEEGLQEDFFTEEKSDSFTDPVDVLANDALEIEGTWKNRKTMIFQACPSALSHAWTHCVMNFIMSAEIKKRPRGKILRPFVMRRMCRRKTRL